MIRSIIFDCFGVLYHGSLDQMFELTRPDRHQEMRDLHHSYDYGYIDKRDFLAGASDLMDVTTGELQKLLAKEHVRNDLLIDYIKTLRPTYKTALLSNVGRDFLDDLFTQDELRDLFDVEVLSAEVGMMKPSSGIFLATAEKLGLAPNECVMVDDAQANCAAAEFVGMTGLEYRNVQDVKDKLGVLMENSHA